MKFTLIKSSNVLQISKFGISLNIYPKLSNLEIVLAETKDGHNQEFYNKVSTYTYIILEGQGSFFLDDEEVPVSKGDFLSIPPKTRIYYKGQLSLVLITTPPWKESDEFETKHSIW